jgi:sterol 3beta-glucosyltransferase
MRIGLQTWGSEGDIRPFIALAAGLVRAGHQVTLLVTDDTGRDYSSLTERAGVALRPVAPPTRPDPEAAAALWHALIAAGNPIRQAELIMAHGFDPVMEDMYTAAQDLCARSELVIGHFFVFPLQVAAEKARVPWVTVNIVHNCLPSAYICPPGLPSLVPWFYRVGWHLVRRMVNRIFLPRVNALRIREGLRPHRDVMTMTWAAERLNLIAVSPHICERPRDWEDRHQVCGFLNPPTNTGKEEIPSELEDFLASGPAPVYVTFGSMMPPTLRQITETVSLWSEAVHRVGCRAILQVPWDDLSLFERDQQVFTVTRSPYVEVFPRCAAIIHHGGAGTTQSSLLAGTPSVVVAHMADQFFWGAELRRLGVAGTTLLRRSVTAQKLAGEIATVLASPSMKERAIVVSQSMAKEDGVKTAVQLIARNFG